MKGYLCVIIGLTCDRAKGREADEVQQGNSQGHRSCDSYTNTGDNKETNWTELECSVVPLRSIPAKGASHKDHALTTPLKVTRIRIIDDRVLGKVG